MVSQEEYVAAELHLAKLLNVRPGKDENKGVTQQAGPRWMHSNTDAFALLAEHLEGYYEARKGSAEHCIVVPNQSLEATVVYLRDHATKELALRYAFVKAVIAKALEAARWGRAHLSELVSE
jgi:hypothetical protein